jgi:hypothetical protein
VFADVNSFVVVQVVDGVLRSNASIVSVKTGKERI